MEWLRWYSSCLACTKPSSNPSTAKEKKEYHIPHKSSLDDVSLAFQAGLKLSVHLSPPLE
jgi:hypothetical protein